MIAGLMLAGLSLALQDAGGAASKGATRPTPYGMPQTWVTDEDYPDAAIWERQSGTVAARLDVGADGVPSGCSVTASSGSAVLDRGTCELFRQRARFNPARDAAGKPIPGSYDFKFTWVLPQGEGQFGSWIFFNEIRVQGGRIAGCMAQSRGVGFSRVTSGPCVALGAPVPAAMAPLLAGPNAGATIKVIETHIVGGDATPAIERPAGKPFYERRIRFDVDAAGNVANCKLVSGAAAQDPLGYVAHRCHSGMRYPPLAGSKRSVEMTVSMYLTRDPPPPRDPAEGPTV
ncbi:energy transducer TonB [Sphingomonas sp. KR3-1]|uniref:energy transducer TonB n=1 Tax=Sphingomonas sp. KR3-1 TaxID=3156611 RepID=UPI0032B51D30